MWGVPGAEEHSRLQESTCKVWALAYWALPRGALSRAQAQRTAFGRSGAGLLRAHWP